MAHSGSLQLNLIGFGYGIRLGTRVLIRNLLVSVCMLCLSGIGLAEVVKAPRGWSDLVEGERRVVSNDNTTIVIWPWQDLAGVTLEDWLKGMENTPPPGTQLLSSSGVIRETVPGAYSVTRKVAFPESKGLSVLYACPGQNGLARLLTMDVTNGGFKDTLVGAIFGEKVCKREPKPATVVAGTDTGIAADDAPPTELPPVVDTGSAMPVHSNSARAPKSLVALRGVIVMGMQPGGMFGVTDDFIALFDDGTYTEDLVNTFGSSAAESRRKKPKRWGRWRMNGKEIELRDHNDSDYDKTRGSWIIEPLPNDYRLDGCFGRLNSSSGADYNSGTTVGLAQTWCFWPDGRFTNSRTAFGSSSSASMRASTPKARGAYRIDGNAVRFTYDDGHTVTAAVGYASKDGNHLLLNGKRFMGKR